MAEDATKYWMIVASRDHVRAGVEGGFAQANHGKSSPLKRMKRGDGIIYYSSKEKYGENAKWQRFTAIGRVADDEVYQGVMGGGFEPFRRRIKFFPCEEVEIQPLIEDLRFIKDKQHWGYMFRLGAFEIDREDYERIAARMLKTA